MLSVSVFLLDCLHSDVTSTGLVVARNYTRSPPDALPMNVRQLGRPFSATFTLTNNGPSTIPSGQFQVYVPYRTPCETNAFLYYISDITVSLLVEVAASRVVCCALAFDAACPLVCTCSRVHADEWCAERLLHPGGVCGCAGLSKCDVKPDQSWRMARRLCHQHSHN